MTTATATSRLPSNFVIIGNPANRRVGLFRDALAKQNEPPPIVVGWLDLLTRGVEQTLAAVLPADNANGFVRIDSFGEDFEVERALLLRGAAHDVVGVDGDAWRLSADEVRALQQDYGRIVAPRQMHVGFLSVLDELRRALEARPRLDVLPAPESIVRLFDKRACASTFAQVGVPIARPLEANVQSTEELRDRMHDARMTRVFVKLTCGSSASCLALYDLEEDWLFTSMEIAGPNLYNSLKPRRYTDRTSIDRLLGFLLREGSHIEEHVPKARVGGRFFDTRMLVIGGDVAFTVVRKSQHPITNLHLGGTRGTLEELASKIRPDVLEAAHESCRRVFEAHACLHLGIDVMFTAAGDGHVVLEANAFGDLLPNLERDGLSVFEWEIRSVRSRSRPRRTG